MISLQPAIKQVTDTVGQLAGAFGVGVLGWQQQHMGELSPHLFVSFQDRNTGVMVRGRIVSMSETNQADWQNKFEGTGADEKAPIISALLQSGIYADYSDTLLGLSGKTLITKAQTVQVWTGMQPQELTFEVEFRAFSNASLEVEQPIQALKKMMSPELNKNFLDNASKIMAGKSVDDVMAATDKAKKISGSADKNDAKKLGEVPSDIAVSTHKKRFVSTYRIESISEDEDQKLIDRNGNRVYQLVSITLGSTAGIMKSDVKDGSTAGAVASIGESMDSILNKF